MVRLIIWLKTIKYFFKSFSGSKHSKILTSDKTIKWALENNLSIIRLGDGEFNYLSGKGIHYQDYNSDLKHELDLIVEKYLNDSKSCNYILCVPRYFFQVSGGKLIMSRKYISSWSFSRYVFKNKYDIEGIVYGDSFLFAKSQENIYKYLWLHIYDEVIFVHNDRSYAILFTQMYDISTTFIEIASRNAFYNVDEYYNRIIESYYSNNKVKTVLVSAGPTGKILVYRLSLIGVKAYDTGHCWDSPLHLPEE